MDFLRRRLSDGNFLAGGGMGGDPPSAGGGAGRPPRTPPPTAPLLLVIAPPGTDWVKPFKGKSVHGDVELRVEQAQFSELSLAASTHGALSVSIDPPRGGSRKVRPDFVLVREEPEGGAGGAPRRLLVGLHLGGVPGSDPLPTLYGFSHAPCLFAQLARLQRELGHEAFPLVPQRFCNRPRGLLTAPTFPMTVTLSPAPAGVGQVRVGSPQVLGAVAAAMGGARAGALLRGGPAGTERLRVQRIGDQYRALRWSQGGEDTAGEGPQVEPVALSPRHRAWVDACAGLFGGVDICGVEALRGPDGQEQIVQVLGSWLPLLGPGAAEDQAQIVELVLERMREELPRPRSPSPARPRPQVSVTSGTPRPGTTPQQRPQPQGAPPPSTPAQPRPQPQGQPRPQMGGASPRPTQPSPAQPRGPSQPRPLAAQPRPQTPTATPQPHPTSPQPRPQTPPSPAQPRPQTPPSSPQPHPQPTPTSQPRPPLAASAPQPRPSSPQPRPQTSPTSQPRPQAPPTSQPRPPGPAVSPQPRPQAPPASQPRPQAPPTSAPQPRPQGPPTSPQPRPQAPPTSAQPRLQRSPSVPQPRPQASPSSTTPRPPGPQAPPTTRQPRPQAPPIAPKPVLAPKPGSAPPPSPAPEQGPPESLRALRQSFASLFSD